MKDLPDAGKLPNMDPDCSAFEPVNEQMKESSYIQSMYTLLYCKHTFKKHENYMKQFQVADEPNWLYKMSFSL